VISLGREHIELRPRSPEEGVFFERHTYKLAASAYSSFQKPGDGDDGQGRP